MRLKQKNIKIRLIIDWFENQVIDKAFNMGIRKFLPDVKLKGYQVVDNNPFYLCYFPSKLEYDSRVLPSELYVSGKSFIPTIKENCPELKAKLAPAFRYSHIYKKREEQSNNMKSKKISRYWIYGQGNDQN